MHTKANHVRRRLGTPQESTFWATGIRTMTAQIKDRAIRSNEREYTAAISIWNLFVEVFNATCQAVNGFKQRPRLNALLSPDQMSAILNSFDINPGYYQSIINTEHPDQEFEEVLHWMAIEKADPILYDAAENLEKESIFVDSVLENQFKDAMLFVAICLDEQRNSITFGGLRGTVDKPRSAELMSHEGKKLKNDLRDEVRKRLYRGEIFKPT